MHLVAIGIVTVFLLVLSSSDSKPVHDREVILTEKELEEMRDALETALRDEPNFIQKYCSTRTACRVNNATKKIDKCWLEIRCAFPGNDADGDNDGNNGSISTEIMVYEDLVGDISLKN